jgi:hypothetical protein
MFARNTKSNSSNRGQIATVEFTHFGKLEHQEIELYKSWFAGSATPAWMRDQERQEHRPSSRFWVEAGFSSWPPRTSGHDQIGLGGLPPDARRRCIFIGKGKLL